MSKISKREILLALSDIARGYVPEGPSGKMAQPSVRERLQALELLARREHLFSDPSTNPTQQPVVLHDLPPTPDDTNPSSSDAHSLTPSADLSANPLEPHVP